MESQIRPWPEFPRRTAAGRRAERREAPTHLSPERAEEARARQVRPDRRRSRRLRRARAHNPGHPNTVDGRASPCTSYARPADRRLHSALRDNLTEPLAGAGRVAAGPCAVAAGALVRHTRSGPKVFAQADFPATATSPGALRPVAAARRCTWCPSNRTVSCVASPRGALTARYAAGAGPLPAGLARAAPR